MHHQDSAVRSTVADLVDPAERLSEELRRLGIDPGEACARAGVSSECLGDRAMLFEEIVALAVVCGRRPAYFFNG